MEHLTWYKQVVAVPRIWSWELAICTLDIHMPEYCPYTCYSPIGLEECISCRVPFKLGIFFFLLFFFRFFKDVWNMSHNFLLINGTEQYHPISHRQTISCNLKPNTPK